jgi:hypothetical protein
LIIYQKISKPKVKAGFGLAKSKKKKKKLSEQSHTDKNGIGQFKNWQGTRFFDYTFYFRVI